MPYFSISSRHCLCVAKQAIAHILISTPVWNCFPRMSHTPWLGVATVRFCRNKSNIFERLEKKKPMLFSVSAWQREVYHSNFILVLHNATELTKTANACRKSLFKVETKEKARNLTRPPYCNMGAGSTRPVTWAISSRTLNWNSWTNGSAS